MSSRFLLDSHALVFAAVKPEGLGSKARRAIESEHSQIYVSSVSIWELLLKARKGKIDFGADPTEELQSFCRKLRAEMLPLMAQHAYTAMKLDPIHKDPFDRMLVAQAKSEGLTLITKDGNISGYDVDTIW